MKKRLYALTDNILFDRFIALLDRIDRESDDLLRILTYHRVDEITANPNLDPVLLSTTPRNFARQMAFIKNHYTPVSVQEVLAYYKDGTLLPKRAMLITFDDAYCDFEKHAWPILKQYDIPVTLFVPTAYPDNPEKQLWWDKLFNAVNNTRMTSVKTPIGEITLKNRGQRALVYKQLTNYVKQLPHTEAMEWVDSFCGELEVSELSKNSILGWAALRMLAKEGVTLAPHTHTHPLMNRVDQKEARHEIIQSWEDLKSKIGETLPIFAYPSGGVSDEVVQVLEDEGIKLAFTTVRGINNLKTTNPLLLRRINIGRSTTLPMLRAQCLPSVAYLG